MIVAVVGPVESEVKDVAELLAEDKQVQVVNSLEVIRMMDRKHVNSITTKASHKKVFLSKLADELATVIVYGNVLLSEDICEWVQSLDDGVVVVVSRDKMENYPPEVIQSTSKYWGDTELQRYEMENRFKAMYQRLSKCPGASDCYWVDLTSESQPLNYLLADSNEWESFKWGLTAEDILKIVTKGEDDNMTMEDSIKKAMLELGIDLGDVPEEPKKTEPVKEKPKPEPVKKQPKVEPEPAPEPETKEDDETPTSLCVKMDGDTMALLIPEGLEMEEKEIGGIKFKVATVNKPDFNSDKLQELPLYTEPKPETRVEPKVESKPEPKVESKPEPKVEKELPSDLEGLMKAKKAVDLEIKEARKAGDTNRVEELRKQRHKLRREINKLI